MPESSILFPIAEYWWFYGSFIVFVLAMLALDLGVFHRKAHVVGVKEALTWSFVWISLALIFNFIFWQYGISKFGPAVGNRLGLEFLTGYLIEKALSVDNVFVFALVFAAFAVPPQYQHRVLFYGILGALVFRGIFISIGSVLMQYHWVVIAAGVFLILTAIKMVFLGGKPKDPKESAAIKLLAKFVPLTPEYDGQRFFVRRNGVLMATPLFAALVFVEFSDIIFAIDSVPAIFAITKEPLIVFTSNVFAILGLRAMFFLLSGIMGKFWALTYALAAILVFVGLKMVWLNEAFGGKFPIGWSLGIIGLLLALGVVISLAFKTKESAVDPSQTP